MKDLRSGFDEVADVYDRVRPSYPDALFEELFTRLPDPCHLVEVGAGESPDVWLAIIDTVQVVSSDEGGFFERSQSVYEKYGDAMLCSQLPVPQEAGEAVIEELRATTLFEGPRLYRYRWDQSNDVNAYVDLLRSYSRT